LLAGFSHGGTGTMNDLLGYGLEVVEKKEGLLRQLAELRPMLPQCPPPAMAAGM